MLIFICVGLHKELVSSSHIIVTLAVCKGSIEDVSADMASNETEIRNRKLKGFLS